MNAYAILHPLHITLALISGLGFALRGFVRIVQNRPLSAHPLVRVGPHVVDTLLLATGIALWVVVRYSPLAPPWFGVKLLLVVVYIALGITAMRAPNRWTGIIAYPSALLVFLAVVALALYKPL